MNRKIIIKADDFDKEIRSFLMEIGADMPIDWNIEAIDYVRNAVIKAFENMSVTLEIAVPPQPSFYGKVLGTKDITEKIQVRLK
jgi:hypothetical protein